MAPISLACLVADRGLWWFPLALAPLMAVHYLVAWVALEEEDNPPALAEVLCGTTFGMATAMGCL